MEARFYQDNRAHLLGRSGDRGLILLFGSSAPYRNARGYYGRALDMSFFYMTGLQTPNAILAVWSERGACRARLFMERQDPEEEKWSGLRMAPTEAAAISGVEHVASLGEFDEFLADMLSSPGIDSLCLDMPEWYAEDVPAPIDTFTRRMRTTHPAIGIVNVRGVIAEMRRRKQPGEIECIRRAVANARAGIETMMSAVRPGMYEYQLQAVCHNMLHHGGEMQASPMVAAGANAVILHYAEPRAIIREGDLVLVDFCPRVNYYASDVSRAFPASGRFSRRQRELYGIALDANKRMIDAVGPGMGFHEMNQLARRFLADGMLSIGLISSRDEVERYYYHGVSHYVGLDIHDVGDPVLPVPQDAVLTIDTGVYVAEEGIGMRVEDDVLITAGGCEVLSASSVKEIADIERIMASRAASA